MQKVVLITAGGSGSRMNSPVPKQFLEIAGKPVLMHTFNAFLRHDASIEFILVLPARHFDLWQSLCAEYGFSIRHKLVENGPTRFHSVKNGLKHVADDALLAIHDGVRPLVSAQTIERCFTHAQRYGNAVPVVSPSESLRQVEGSTNRIIPREKIRVIQTPQCFRAELIKKAYNRNFMDHFTDDSSVLEAEGEKINLVEGNPENIKITGPADLIIARALLEESGFVC